MKKKELTPDQKRLVMEISLSNSSILSNNDQMAILELPPDIMPEKLLIYIKTRCSLDNDVMLQVFHRHKDVGKDVIKACLKTLSGIPYYVQLEIFNLPVEWRHEMLITLADNVHSLFCDETLFKIFALPQKQAVEILTIYLNHYNELSEAAELKILDYDQATIKEIFLRYHHVPSDATLKKVVESCDDATIKEIFLASLTHVYTISGESMSLVFDFPESSRDEILKAYFKRSNISYNILRRVCTLPDPIRKTLLMSYHWAPEALALLFELPEPTRSDILLNNIKKAAVDNWSTEQLAAVCGFEEPWRTKLLEAYGERFGFFFEGATELITQLPEPLQRKMEGYYLNAIASSEISTNEFTMLLALEEPLRTKALSAYFADSKAKKEHFEEVFKLPDHSRTTILLAAMKSNNKWDLFNYWYMSSPCKKQLFELPEPSRTTVITAFVKSGLQLDEPWMLWLLPEKTREPLIKVYAQKHKKFDPAYYEKKIKELLGEIPE